MRQGEHSAILSTFIKLAFVIKIFVLSIFEWLFTQVLLYHSHSYSLMEEHVAVHFYPSHRLAQGISDLEFTQMDKKNSINPDLVWKKYFSLPTTLTKIQIHLVFMFRAMSVLQIFKFQKSRLSAPPVEVQKVVSL